MFQSLHPFLEIHSSVSILLYPSLSWLFFRFFLTSSSWWIKIVFSSWRSSFFNEQRISDNFFLTSPLYQIVVICKFNELLVKFYPVSFVSCVSKICIYFPTVLIHYFWIIILIVDQEILWIFVDINIDFSENIMKSWLLDFFLISWFKPILKHS